MAAAEARAVWQRTANRYFIQEDAKRAPKLAACCSISSVMSKIDRKLPVNPADLDDSWNEKSFCSNLSSDSKWWIQLQPDCMYQRGLASRKSHRLVENQVGSSVNFLSSKGSYDFVEMDSAELPWSQMGEKDNLGSFPSKKSHILIENCDLIRPVKSGSEPQKIKCCQTAILRDEWQSDTSKRKILEALCHSQTRAREAEFAAKKAYAEKEHMIKLVFRQASQLFAYRQWIYLLQLENLCYQLKNKNTYPTLSVLPVSPSKIGKLDENLKNMRPAKGKGTRTKHGSGRFKDDFGGFVVVFAIGLGIVGAGLILGWTVGWMLI